MVCEDAALGNERVKLYRRQPGCEKRVDLFHLLDGELEVLVDRRLEEVLLSNVTLLMVSPSRSSE